MLRARQIWGGAVALPGLREALGLADDASRTETDVVEARAHALVAAMEDRGWAASAADAVVGDVLGGADDAVAAVLRFAAEEVVPRLERTTDELDAVLHALSGGYVPAGPSGSTLRGLVNVWQTGLYLLSYEPRATSPRLAW